MRPEIYWVLTSVGRLAIMPRPRAGDWLEDEIAGWRREGVDLVVSLLEPGEISELGLDQEAELCEAHEMEFVAFPISDRGVPASLKETMALVRSIFGRISEGKAVAIHCRAGIGRSSLIAACVLVCSGLTSDAAFEMIEKTRAVRVPDTNEQREWVERCEKATKTAL